MQNRAFSTGQNEKNETSLDLICNLRFDHFFESFIILKVNTIDRSTFWPFEKY